MLAAVQRPISLACITVSVDRPLSKAGPAWYLVAEGDRMIVHDNQRFMAQRMHARVHTHTCRSCADGRSAPSVVVDIVRAAIQNG